MKFFVIFLTGLFFIACAPRNTVYCYDGQSFVVCPKGVTPGTTIQPKTPLKKVQKSKNSKRN